MAITLAQLKQSARERADMVDSDFVEDPELTEYINKSIAELHDILVQTYGQDYYLKEVEFQLNATTQSYNLSDIIPDNDFYKLRGIDVKLNGADWFSLQPFNFNQRNRFQSFGTWDYLGATNVRYRLIGSRLMFSPVPDSSIPARIWYIPTAKQLVDDTDELEDLNQFSEYVVVDAAIKMLVKEETDVSVLMAQKEALRIRIVEAATNRDAGDSPTISDVFTENTSYYFSRGRGI